MKRIIYTFLIGMTFSLIGCKKADEVPPTYEGRTKADDASGRSELDRVSSDIEKVYNSQEYADASGMRTSSNLRTTSTAILPCGKVTFNLNSNSKNFSIDYSQSGSNCTPYRVLSGSIDVTLVNGTYFSDQGSKLQVVFNKYKVLYTNSNQSVTYEGTTYITNTSGGSIIGLFTSTPNAEIIHKVRGDLTLSYDTLGASPVIRSWKIFRKRTFQNTPGTSTGITFKLEGDTSFAASTYLTTTSTATFDYVGELGLNIDNEKFVCNISTPFIWSNCGSSYAGPYVLKQGKVEYVSYTAKPAYVLLGYTKYYWTAEAGYKTDAIGSSIFDGTCDSDGYKLNFALMNDSGTSIYSVTAFQPY
ncbi:hypothetical protein [Cytophaga aurantiaca]|uniref:hypothetical protein n=1 Tax=Cytophaga aurantiaca TaxID=29530 RepID=UPI00036A7497|nr:hypothetical protein [Cytophaga aurantiaca]